MKKAMTARQLRIVLIIAMVLIAGAAIGGFSYEHQMLRDYASQISKLNADAKAGDTNLNTLQSLKNRLATEQNTIAKARAVVADSSTYTNKVIDDVSLIARDSGIKITGFEFTDNAPTVAAPATTAPVTGAVPTVAPGSTTLKTVSVTIESPLSYDSLMTFLKKIETNALRMQISNISITKDKGNNVTTQTFSIEVYVRS